MKKIDLNLNRREFLKTVGISAAALQFPFAAYGATKGELADNQVLKTTLSMVKDLQRTDPAFSTGAPRGIVTSVYNGMVELVPGTVNQLRPGLAERWEFSEDKKIWTFHLRKGIQFHQGFGEMTAEDVKFSFDRLKEIKARWQRPTFKVVEAVDKYTVRITTKEPDSFLLFKVSNFNGGEIVSKKAVQSIGNKAFAMRPIGGTGPFAFEEYIPVKHISFVRNPNYFRGKPVLDRIVYYFISNLNSRLLALKNGDIQLNPQGLGEMQWLDARKNEGFKILGRWGNCYILHMNMSQKPFDNLKVRQAMAYAIDREEISDFYGGVMKPLYGWVSPVGEGHFEKDEIPKKYHYSADPQRAKKLLAEAGFPKGFEIQMVNHSRKVYRDIMEMVQAQLGRVGITLKITASDRALYYDAIFKDRNPLVIWAPLFFNPNEMLNNYWHSASIVTKPTGSLNWSHYGDMVGNIDQLIEESRSTFDEEGRRELHLKAQMKLWEDLPSVTLCYASLGKAVRQPYLDFGYDYINNTDAIPQITEKTRLLEH